MRKCLGLQLQILIQASELALKKVTTWTTMFPTYFSFTPFVFFRIQATRPQPELGRRWNVPADGPWPKAHYFSLLGILS